MKASGFISGVLILFLGFSGWTIAGNGKGQALPPGLQKKVERGGELPPGWQKKLAVGQVLDYDIYRHGKVVTYGDRGVVTISVDGELIRVIENTFEIVEILGG